MKPLFGRKNIKILNLIIAILFLTNLASVYAENGKDVTPNLENTPIENIIFTTPSVDLSEWKIDVLISENSENISKLELETQICIFDPIVCHSPIFTNMDNENNNWSASIITLEKHSYVNWRIHIIYENESEILVPERSDGYAKVWSTCWEIMDDQEIINNFDEGNCGEGSPDEKGIGGFYAITTILSLIMAVSLMRRNQQFKL